MDEFVQKVQAARIAEVDRLQDEMRAAEGHWGVLVETWPDGRWTASLSEDVEPMRVTYLRR